MKQQIIDFGGGVTRQIAVQNTQSRDLMADAISPEEVIETVKMVFSFAELAKLLFVSIRNLFKKTL